jgi:hypothetical protein
VCMPLCVPASVCVCACVCACTGVRARAPVRVNVCCMCARGHGVRACAPARVCTLACVPLPCEPALPSLRIDAAHTPKHTHTHRNIHTAHTCTRTHARTHARTRTHTDAHVRVTGSHRDRCCGTSPGAYRCGQPIASSTHGYHLAFGLPSARLRTMTKLTLVPSGNAAAASVNDRSTAAHFAQLWQTQNRSRGLTAARTFGDKKARHAAMQ